MKKHLPGLLAIALIALTTASTAQAASISVSVRIEGASATLLPKTTVTLDTAGPAIGSCPADSAGAAIDKATGGNWDKQPFTNTIMGETHSFSDSDYWAEWINNGYGSGVCNDTVKNGDAVLMIVDRTPAPDYASTAFPLTVAVPATVTPGVPFTATVTQYGPDGSFSPLSSVPSPAAGVTVSGGGLSAVTDAQGKATLTATAAGPLALRASQTTTRSDVVQTCATTGSDGFCGTTKPGDPPPTPTTPTTPEPVAPAAPVAKIAGGLAEGKSFKPGKAPRTLAGTVSPDPDGIRRVQLRLTRNNAGACSTYAAKYEKWLKTKRCSTAQGRWFTVGTDLDWSYLLPAGLGKGRYVLDVRAIDNRFDYEKTAVRGQNQIVFFVR